MWPAFPGPVSFPVPSHSGLPVLCQSPWSKGCLKCSSNTAGQLSPYRWLPAPRGSFGPGLPATLSWTADAGEPGSGPCGAPALSSPTLHFTSLVWSGSSVPLPGAGQMPGGTGPSMGLLGLRFTSLKPLLCPADAPRVLSSLGPPSWTHGPSFTLLQRRLTSSACSLLLACSQTNPRPTIGWKPASMNLNRSGT